MDMCRENLEASHGLGLLLWLLLVWLQLFYFQTQGLGCHFTCSAQFCTTCSRKLQEIIRVNYIMSSLDSVEPHFVFSQQSKDSMPSTEILKVKKCSEVSQSSRGALSISLS